MRKDRASHPDRPNSDPKLATLSVPTQSRTAQLLKLREKWLLAQIALHIRGDAALERNLSA